MKRALLAAAAVLFLVSPALSAAEKLDEEIAKLRAEVAALRGAIERLAGRNDDPSAAFARLLEVARRVAGGEKLADGSPELAFLRETLVAGYRSAGGNELGARALGVVRSLPAGQRSALLAAVLADLSAGTNARQTALRELAAGPEDALRAALLKAMELERTAPPARQLAMGWPMTADLRPELALAGFRLKEKAAVDFAIDYLVEVVRSFEAGLRARREGGNPHFGPSLYGPDAELARRLGAWSANAEIRKRAPADMRDGRGWAGTSFKTEEETAAFLVELGKVREWWKAAQEKFDFPAEAAAPVGGPAKDPGKGPEQF